MSQPPDANLRAAVREILELHTEAKLHANSAKRFAYNALHAAWQCGTRLEAAKETIPQGEWERWCKACLPEISTVTIWRYRRLASRFPSLPGEDDASSIRQVYLQLGLIADEEAEQARSRQQQRRNNRHSLAKVNALAKWLAEEQKRKPFRDRTPREITRLKRDLYQIYEHLADLFDPPDNPSQDDAPRVNEPGVNDPPGKESLTLPSTKAGSAHVRSSNTQG